MFREKNIKLANGINGSKEALESCARLYCKIWREPPWNEDFWKVEGVIEDMLSQFQKTLARAYFAWHNGIVIGFTWGYQTDQKEMAQIGSTQWTEREEEYFYIDELGVDSDYRGRGIGKALTKEIIEGIDLPITLRTDVLAVEARELYRKLGFQEIKLTDGSYPTRTYWILRKQ